MSGSYPITAVDCATCERLEVDRAIPISASLASNRPLRADAYPGHNWYRFVHSYSPLFVSYEIEKKGIMPGQKVLDPFVGTGTTLVECKLREISSLGVDPIDFLVFVSNVKTEWKINADELACSFSVLRCDIEHKMSSCEQFEPPSMLKNYVSPKPLAKLVAIKGAVNALPDGKYKDILRLALAAIILPSSNVRNSPNFGLIKPPVDDVDVMGLLERKVSKMVADLFFLRSQGALSTSHAIKGDARGMSANLPHDFDHIITSPPYPQEHDYSRTTRVELVLLDYLTDMQELRALKKTMLRASTRNVYAEDNDYQLVSRFNAVRDVVEQIGRRVKDTNGTSGFEKNYAKLVGEYFGGMYRAMQEMFQVLKEHGTAAILVADSHAFKMVHIETAKLLGELALDIGFSKYELEPWLNIRSTAHNYAISEYILELYK